METIRWGILGTGSIAHTFAGDFPHVPRAELAAVASRSLEKAQAFAGQCGAERAYGSYLELLDDEDIDVVYIATPHPHHRDLALAAIERGKATLVEKAFTTTLAGTRQVIDAARQAGVFCMEAMWTRFLPAVAAAREIVAWGRIGEVLGVQGDLSAYRKFDTRDRLFAKELGGGALLDLGVYPISFAQSFLGTAKTVQCVGRSAPNGVDVSAALSIEYVTGGLAALSCAFDAHGAGRIAIHGTKGWIDVQPRFHHPTTLSVHRSGVVPRIIEANFVGRGYAHEIDEVNECLLEGLTESTTMPLSDTLETMRVIEESHRQLGLEHHEADMTALLA